MRRRAGRIRTQGWLGKGCRTSLWLYLLICSHQHLLIYSRLCAWTSACEFLSLDSSWRKIVKTENGVAHLVDRISFSLYECVDQKRVTCRKLPYAASSHVPCMVSFVLRLPLKSVARFTRTKRRSRSQPHLLHYTALDLVVTQQ